MKKWTQPVIQELDVKLTELTIGELGNDSRVEDDIEAALELLGRLEIGS